MKKPLRFKREEWRVRLTKMKTKTKTEQWEPWLPLFVYRSVPLRTSVTSFHRGNVYIKNNYDVSSGLLRWGYWPRCRTVLSRHRKNGAGRFWWVPAPCWASQCWHCGHVHYGNSNLDIGKLSFSFVQTIVFLYPNYSLPISKLQFGAFQIEILQAW